MREEVITAVAEVEVEAEALQVEAAVAAAAAAAVELGEVEQQQGEEVRALAVVRLSSPGIREHIPCWRKSKQASKQVSPSSSFNLLFSPFYSIPCATVVNFCSFFLYFNLSIVSALAVTK